MWKWILVLMVVASVVGNFYHLRPYAPFHKRNSKKYCGEEISNALVMLCHGIYNPMFKKSAHIEDGSLDDYLQSENEIPVSPKEQVLSLFSKNYLRDKRGVNDECCRKSCSIRELSTYCAANDK